MGGKWSNRYLCTVAVVILDNSSKRFGAYIAHTLTRASDAPPSRQAQKAPFSVVRKGLMKPNGTFASSKLYHALVCHIDADTRPNLEKIRYDHAEKLIIQDSTSRALMIDLLTCSHHLQRSTTICFEAGPSIEGLRLREQLTPCEMPAQFLVPGQIFMPGPAAAIPPPARGSDFGALAWAHPRKAAVSRRRSPRGLAAAHAS